MLAISVDDAYVNGELIANNGAATVALLQFDPFDLRWQLATFNHRDIHRG